MNFMYFKYKIKNKSLEMEMAHCKDGSLVMHTAWQNAAISMSAFLMMLFTSNILWQATFTSQTEIETFVFTIATSTYLASGVIGLTTLVLFLGSFGKGPHPFDYEKDDGFGI